MDNANTYIIMDAAKLAEALKLDQTHDLWTARMIRWVKFRIPPRSIINGIEWEHQQDLAHQGESYATRQKYLRPNAPTEITFWNLPTHCTLSMTSSARNNRHYARLEEEKLAAKAKFDAGEELDEEEQHRYEMWLNSNAPCEPIVVDCTPSELALWGAPGAVVSEEESKKSVEGDWASGYVVEIGNDTVCATDLGETGNITNDSNEQSCWSQSDEETGSVFTSAEDSQECEVEEFDARQPGGCWYTPLQGFTTLYDDEMGQLERNFIYNKWLAQEYTDGVRGIHYELPAGLGLHIQRPPPSNGSLPCVEPEDALDNLPGNMSFVYRPREIQEYNVNCKGQLLLEAPGVAHEQDDLVALYSSEVCHKDGTWLVKDNPVVTPEMIAECQSEINDNKNEAIKALDMLKLVGKNLELLTSMITMIMKDTKLCQAIHAELLKRDIGFIKKDDNKPFRFHGRIETIFANLDRWASTDMESAIEDIRLMLEDHELILEIIDAINGAGTQTDRLLIDPNPFSYPCVNCGKSLEELAVIYGCEHSTLMAAGCQVCEDVRLKKASELLWQWWNNPDELSDEEFEKIFGVAKDFEYPEECFGDSYDSEETTVEQEALHGDEKMGDDSDEVGNEEA